MTKIATFFLLLNGVLWIWSSYILAYLGRDQIAETLSERALMEILGVFFIYAVKSLFENLSKNNAWPDSSCCEEESNTEQSELSDQSESSGQIENENDNKEYES